jgi:hypothetical protein
VDRPEQRASDAERDAVADRIRVAGGDGRLDPEELEERLEAAYRAKTHGELEVLTNDLPAVPKPPPKRDPAWRDERVREKLAGFIVANLICIGIWAATGANGSFWPAWVLLFTGIGLVSTLVHSALGVEQKRHRHERLPRGPRPPRLPRL